MKKLFINLRYLLAPAFILAAMYGVFIGGPWVWTGVVLLGLGIVVDAILSYRTPGAGIDDDGNTNGWPGFQTGVMYTMLGVFVLLQLTIAWRIYEYTTGVPLGMAEMFGIQVYQGITGAQLVGAVLSTGIFAGIGIIYGHELSHTKGLGFMISRWMMALSGSAHFCYAHVYNHHLELASEDDPATAPRGRSIYIHLPKSYFGQSKFLYSMEKQRLAKLDKPFLTWENRWLRGYAMSLPSLFLFWLAGGWLGVACLALIWIISNFELEALNYMEHYGLIREKGEPIDYRHSWDNSTMLTSWFFIEIGRQADHHDRGETHFWELDEVGAPNTKHGYFSLFAIALLPPLYHAFMNKQLKQWDKECASEGEIAIANAMNKQAGYA
jgi:alkane 1-monooxygenase